MNEVNLKNIINLEYKIILVPERALRSELNTFKNKQKIIRMVTIL